MEAVSMAIMSVYTVIVLVCVGLGIADSRRTER